MGDNNTISANIKHNYKEIQKMAPAGPSQNESKSSET